MKLIVNEMFLSIDGEVNDWGQGIPSVFIRLAGCNLQCPYCDTKNTWDKKNGIELTIEQIVVAVVRSKFKKVTITGGEPLLQQKGLLGLFMALPPSIQISIETNGTLPIPIWDSICWVVDYKLHINQPLSDFIRNLPYYPVWIKILISNRNEFEQAKKVASFVKGRGVLDKVAIGIIHGKVTPEQAFEWFLEGDREFLPHLNIQIHKYIFPNGEKISIMP